DIPQHAVFARCKAPIVLPRLSQTERPVGAPADDFRILVVLTVILPEADRADAARASLLERAASAAGTIIPPAPSEAGSLCELGGRYPSRTTDGVAAILP